LPSVYLKLNGSKLEQVTAFRYLGVIVDDVLHCTPHTETVFHKINRLVGICYKLPHWCLNIYTILHCSFMHLHILYFFMCNRFKDIDWGKQKSSVWKTAKILR